MDKLDVRSNNIFLNYIEICKLIPKDLYALVNARVATAGETDRLIGAIAAKIIASIIPVPPTEVTHPDSYFIGFVVIDDVISAFNEASPIDIKATKDLALRLWQVRYNACYPKPKAIVSHEFDFFCTWFGVPTFVGVDDFAFLTRNKTTINLFSNPIELAFA